jgi:hypothetical protein
MALEQTGRWLNGSICGESGCDLKAHACCLWGSNLIPDIDMNYAGNIDNLILTK